jgi:hypothetical protein
VTNLDYIGFGYNIMKGNPHETHFDPGFTQPILNLTYEEVLFLFFWGQRPLVPLLLLGPPFFPIILLGPPPC